jgi:hypothetical protein
MLDYNRYLIIDKYRGIYKICTFTFTRMPAHIKDLISIQSDADIPKYLQVSNGVIRAIEERKLKKGDHLPSLRQLSDQLHISFDTAKKAYDVLKKRNIVVAAHGKSNIVNVSGPMPAFRIFLLFNKLGSHKRIIYDAFTQAFPSNTEIDLQVYNNNLHLFRNLIKNRKTGYSHYVIIPHLADDAVEIGEIIDEYLKDEKLIILDKLIPGIQTEHATVHEDFENDIYSALLEAKPSLSKYQCLTIIFPENSYYPPEILLGFTKFANRHGFKSRSIMGITSDTQVTRGEVFILLTDEDLAMVIQLTRSEKFKIGKDIGIISYNETPLKQVLLNGITTISTDFKRMGRLAALQVMSNSNEQVAVPFRLTLRSSL